MELLCLEKLKWDVAQPTAHDFLEQFIFRLPASVQRHSKLLKRHAQTFIALCYTGEWAF